jgi:DNA polymerase-1
LHTTFNQTIAATGRLSSINPNLQNIPIRTERGRKIRKAFIPRDKDHVLMAADYSQIELRIIAAITKDEGMQSAFKNNEDIHTATASKVFGVKQEEVDRDMRRKAKAVNFGIAYGQSAFGLSQTLKISRKEAKEIIDNYFEQFPGIKGYMAKTIEFAREKGYVETLLGRRRYLRDINSKNHTVRSQAERNAINSPIQGSAADMIKIAMINVDKAMKKAKLKSKMILQVHDELVFDVFKPELEELKKLVEEEMKNAIPDIGVPIKVEAGVGENWLEAH